MLFDDDERGHPPGRWRAARVAGVGTGLALGAAAMWLAAQLGMVPVGGDRDVVMAEPVERSPVVSPAPSVEPARAPDPPAPRPVPRPASGAAPRPPSPAPVAALPATPPAHAEPGHLSINATPWGYVTLDGAPVGNTPALDLEVAPGEHVVRVQRDGYASVLRVVTLPPGRRLRITDIILKPTSP